jgi:CRISPR-associated endonuclease/helicase Cas3
MLSLQLLPQDEYLWLGDNPSFTTFPVEKGFYPLYHQWRTYNSDAAIIVNTHNTGTGKTKAALLRLLKRARMRGRLTSVRDDVLLIAPTNELLLQHAKDAEEFCAQNEELKPYRVTPITKELLDKDIAREGFSEEKLRSGAGFRAILGDPSKIDDDTEKKATIYVVNPDIFYYAIYYCYHENDKAGLAREFLAGMCQVERRLT